MAFPKSVKNSGFNFVCAFLHENKQRKSPKFVLRTEADVFLALHAEGGKQKQMGES